MTTPASGEAPTAGSIVKATVLALAVAAVVLLVAVLPAEFGIDPTGAGRLLGLNALATGAGTAIAAQEQPYNTDTAEFVLGSYETVEYKYRLASGASLQYQLGNVAPGHLRLPRRTRRRCRGLRRELRSADAAQSPWHLRRHVPGYSRLVLGEPRRRRDRYPPEDRRLLQRGDRVQGEWGDE